MNQTQLKNPGPGSYHEKNNLRYKQSPSYAQGSMKRPEAVDPQLKLVPGPGTYPATSRIGDMAKYSMGSRTAAGGIWQDKRVPGAGTYTPQNVTFTSPKFTMKGKYK